jgi:hypothetical protein
MADPLEIAVGSSSLVRAGAPSDGSGGSAGLYVPRYDVNGGLRGRIGDGSLGLFIDSGLSNDAYAVASDMLRPRTSTTGLGVDLAYAVGPGPWRLGIAVELIEYIVSYEQTWTCVKNCDLGTAPPSDRGTESIGVASVGLTPSYRLGRWVLFGSLTVRNHPTLEKSDVVLSYGAYPPHVESGPWNGIAGAGFQVDLAGSLRALVQAYVPFSATPVVYPPTLAAALVLGFGR